MRIRILFLLLIIFVPTKFLAMLPLHDSRPLWEVEEPDELEDVYGLKDFELASLDDLKALILSVASKKTNINEYASLCKFVNKDLQDNERSMLYIFGAAIRVDIKIKLRKKHDEMFQTLPEEVQCFFLKYVEKNILKYLTRFIF